VPPIGRRPTSTFPRTNASLGRPQLHLLTRADAPTGLTTSRTDRNWYRRLPYVCKGEGGATGCDEWPWYVTAEGGPGRAHLRIIPEAHHTTGGSDIRSFYTRCGIQLQEQFIVLPWPTTAVELGVPSVRLCED
jgi:hypothetical protein